MPNCSLVINMHCIRSYRSFLNKILVILFLLQIFCLVHGDLGTAAKLPSSNGTSYFSQHEHSPNAGNNNNNLRKAFKSEQTSVTSYNDLLNAKNIFPSRLNSLEYPKDGNGDEAALASLKSLLEDNSNLQQLYNAYKMKFSKTPSASAEESSRTIFKNKLIEIAAHNLEARRGKHLWEKGVNQFTDISMEEHEAQHTGFVPVDNHLGAFPSNRSQEILRRNRRRKKSPKSLDWVRLNKVSSVKDQGPCQSCVLYATSSMIDSAYAIKHGSVPELSPQELLDCSDPVRPICETGSYATVTLNYVKNYGVSEEGEYRVRSDHQKSECHRSKSARIKIKSWWKIPYGEKSLRDAVARGPCIAGIYSIADYDHGIYQGNDCPEEKKSNHAVLVVGYGSENGNDFWLIKNSYGDTWGEGGYLRLWRNNGNVCQIGVRCMYSVSVY